MAIEKLFRAVEVRGALSDFMSASANDAITQRTGSGPALSMQAASDKLWHCDIAFIWIVVRQNNYSPLQTGRNISGKRKRII